jgi:hypothetical protein
MSPHVEQTRPDPLADEPHLKPALRPTHNSTGIPGTKVIICCLAIDLVLFTLNASVRKSAGSGLSEAIAVGALYGILAAQVAMAAIWLGLMVTVLYWMLVGMILFCVAVMALLPARIPWPGLLVVVWWALSFTLPFALVRLAGFRIEEMRARAVAGEPVRFPLSRLFAWTFVIAAILGVSQALPTPVAISLATSLRFFAVAVVGLATLWAVLWPGSVRHPRSFAPFALLAVVVFFEQRAYSLGATDVTGVATAGLLYILTLAGLLAIYRTAGWRLVASSGRGWLVR